MQTEHDAKKNQETLPGSNFRLFAEDIGTRPQEQAREIFREQLVKRPSMIEKD